MALDESSSTVQMLVGGICTNLDRAYRGFRLYPRDHPAARQTLENLERSILPFVEQEGSLTFDVEEDRLLFEGESAYSQTSDRDSLAFLLFRGGIRSVSFRHGLDAVEMEIFLECLACADDLANAEHDLATALWERDLAHIDCRVADPFSGGETLRAGTVDVLRETVVRRLYEISPPMVPEAGIVVGDLSLVEQIAIDERDLALTPLELELSERLAEEPSDVWWDFTVTLLEIVGGSPERITEDDLLTRCLATAIEWYLESRNVESVQSVFDRLIQLEAEGRCSSEFVGVVVETGVTKKGLSRILEGTGQKSAEEVACIDGVLGAMCRWIYPVLLELLVETEDRSVRKTLLAVLGRERAVPAPHLAPLFQDPRWYVLRNAVQLAAGSHDPEILGHLERLVRYPDVRVRRELARTLDTLGEGPALQVLILALSDEDSSVRTLAARGLGRQGGHEHEAAVLAQIEAHDFDGRPAEEIEAFLLSLAALAQDRAVPVLNKLWRRKRLRSRPSPVRLAAVRALGSICDAAARKALEEAAVSGDERVKQAALRALHEEPAR